ncbi:MAG: elements of external origin [Pseudomonadota bacterium]|nr:elements of external origin [Pseudomonadota bacterium]
MTMSVRAYARHRGVSHVAVMKAIKAGRISAEPDGSIDPAKADAAWQISTDPSKQRGKMKPVPTAAVTSVGETLKSGGHAAPTAGNMTFLQAKTANEVLKAQERKLKLERMRGDLIDRKKATALVFKLGRQERDAWLTWPARVAALMASEMGVEAGTMQATLDRHVRDHLNELADLAVKLD